MFSWKKIITVIIKSTSPLQDDQLLELFGYDKATRCISYDKIYAHTLPPEFYLAYVGNYKDLTIISAEWTAELFFDEDANDFEKKIALIYPQAEICAIKYIQQEDLDVWGFSIIQNGKLIRKRFENHDLERHVDFGLPLYEEAMLSGIMKSGKPGERTYIISDREVPEWKSEIGNCIINQLFRRYTDFTLQESTGLLNTTFRAYAI